MCYKGSPIGEKAAIKRAQSHAGMSYAEREQARNAVSNLSNQNKFKKFTIMKTKSMASTAKKSAKEIRMEIKKHVPSSIKGTRECAIVVAMAASILAAPTLDECGKAAVQDMAHELSYTWDPFAGDYA